jgi:hypothetical protein
MDNGNRLCGLWNGSPSAITPGTPVVDVSGDLKVSNLSQTGDIELTGATLDTNAGGNAGTHLRIKINGTYYKISLLQD